MNIIYWTSFNKRKNSTKQPTSGTTLVVKLKDECSIINPIFQSAQMPANTNYIYVAEWSRYYFVTNVVYITNTIKEFSCEVDVLASFKTDIGSTAAQIAFSSTGYDVMKVDSRLACKATKTITAATPDSPASWDATGCYIVSVSNIESNVSMVCHYAMDQANMQTLMQDFLSNTNLKAAVHEYCTDVWDALISCKWIPIAIADVPHSGTGPINLVVANEISSAKGYKLSNPPVRAGSVTLSIPWTYSDFRRTKPFTSLAAWIPGYGFTELNASDLVSDTSLKFMFKVDCITGDCSCTIIDAVDSNIYQALSYNVGVSVPLSNFTMDAQGVINATTGMLSDAASTAIAGGAMSLGGVVSGAFATLASGFNAVMAANKREVSVKGGIGGRAIIQEGIDVKLFAFSIDTEDPDAAAYIARWGRPVGVTHAINNHSGYVECVEASCGMGGTSLEKDRVNQYLNSGFYYE